MKKILLGVSLVLTAALAPAASAHDFFLMPEDFHAPAPGALAIRATVGSSFPTPEILVPVDRTERILANGPGNPKLSVVGPGSTALYLEATGAEPGLLVAGVSSKPRDVDYAEDRIPLILGEYRVAPSAAAAVERLPRPRTWRVSSRRFAKSFMCVESCGNRSAGERPFGFDLEFVGTSAGNDHFLLVAKGQPVANYPVDLVGPDGKRQHLTSDARGAVHIPATARGKMMLFAAALAPPPSGAERFVLDLTSLTFERP